MRAVQVLITFLATYAAAEARYVHPNVAEHAEDVAVAHHDLFVAGGLVDGSTVGPRAEIGGIGQQENDGVPTTVVAADGASFGTTTDSVSITSGPALDSTDAPVVIEVVEHTAAETAPSTEEASSPTVSTASPSPTTNSTLVFPKDLAYMFGPVDQGCKAKLGAILPPSLIVPPIVLTAGRYFTLRWLKAQEAGQLTAAAEARIQLAATSLVEREFERQSAQGKVMPADAHEMALEHMRRVAEQAERFRARGGVNSPDSSLAQEQPAPVVDLDADTVVAEYGEPFQQYGLEWKGELETQLRNSAAQSGWNLGENFGEPATPDDSSAESPVEEPADPMVEAGAAAPVEPVPVVEGVPAAEAAIEPVPAVEAAPVAAAEPIPPVAAVPPVEGASVSHIGSIISGILPGGIVGFGDSDSSPSHHKGNDKGKGKGKKKNQDHDQKKKEKEKEKHEHEHEHEEKKEKEKGKKKQTSTSTKKKVRFSTVATATTSHQHSKTKTHKTTLHTTTKKLHSTSHKTSHATTTKAKTSKTCSSETAHGTKPSHRSHNHNNPEASITHTQISKKKFAFQITARDWTSTSTSTSTSEHDKDAQALRQALGNQCHGTEIEKWQVHGGNSGSRSQGEWDFLVQGVLKGRKRWDAGCVGKAIMTVGGPEKNRRV